jgi:hypothetical protein
MSPEKPAPRLETHPTPQPHRRMRPSGTPLLIGTESPDFRPALVCDDVDGLDLSGLEPATVPEEVPAVVLRNARDPWTHDCRDQRLKIRSIP